MGDQNILTHKPREIMKAQQFMKDLTHNTMRSLATYLFLVLIAFGCTREELVLPAATFNNTPEIFTDVPVNLTDEFFISFDPAEGANTGGFGVDDIIAYEGTTSIRIDVPAATDPDGSFIGGIFEDRGDGRDLTSYNALTFWAKASTTATIGLFGFGTDFGDNTYAASLENTALTTGWKKYVIPIPDPSKLVQEKGMFIFSAGSQSTGGLGYTFWMDELKFEKLGTVAHPLPEIFGGVDQVQSAFNGVTIPVSGASVIYNVDGDEVSVSAAPAYFNFISSDPTVASVDEFGIITVNQAGTAAISATIGDGNDAITAAGSLSVTSLGAFDSAPTPPARDAGDVVSIFSDSYDNVQVDNYNGFFEFATTQGGAISIAGDNIISYTDLNFVSINMFNSPNVDASDMTHLHMDINVRETVSAADYINIVVINNNGSSETSSTISLTSYSALQENAWVSYDIPLTDFAGLGGTDDIDLIFFVSDATISSIYVDNVYFYR